MLPFASNFIVEFILGLTAELEAQQSVVGDYITFNGTLSTGNASINASTEALSRILHEGGRGY